MINSKAARLIQTAKLKIIYSIRGFKRPIRSTPKTSKDRD